MVSLHAPLRIVFFGTPAFALPALEALLASRHDLVAVVTQPDRPRGRGHATTILPVKARAAEAGVPILQPERLKDAGFAAEFDRLGADLGVVAAYGKILPEALLNAPDLGLINVHASLLPLYRGAAPVHRAVIAGERETGVTIMRMVKALDAGPVLATARRPIGLEETSDEVEGDLARIGADLLLSVVERLASGPVEAVPQDNAKASYAHRLTKMDGLVDWNRPAERIHDLIRGLHPWPHAYTFLHGERYILLKSVLCDESGMPSLTSPVAPLTAGTIASASGDRLVVAAGRGGVQILELQVENKRATTARAFLAGHHLAAGDRFDTGP
jgi:methionyl-tRNA formyltransferase